MCPPKNELASITQLVLSQSTTMPAQTRHYCFTLNNWTSDHESFLREHLPSFSYLVYGYETASTGTPHLQGFVTFATKKRFREALALLPEGVHLEAAVGTPYQAAEYCKKGGLFQEFGTPPTPQNRSPFDRFSEWVLQRYQETGRAPTDRETANAFPALYVRYSRALRDLAGHLCPLPVLQEGELRDWQQDLYNMFEHEPDDRTIIFVPDPEGGKGKSWFQRYLVSVWPDKVQCLSVGKRDDIAHAIDNNKSIFLFNVPRGGMEFLQYTILEQIKDRQVFSPKYNSQMKTFMHPNHVVVFSNELPNMEKMTYDRYFLYHIPN